MTTAKLVIKRIFLVAQVTNPKYQQGLSVDGILISQLLEKRDSLEKDFLGRFYRRWYERPIDQTWKDFVLSYQKKHQEHEVALPSKNPVEVNFGNYPEVVCFDLPRMLAYKGNALYDLEEVGINTELQTGFAKALGVLGEGETWMSFAERSTIKVASRDDYKEVAVISQKYPGVAAHVQFYSVADQSAYIAMAALFSTDLFLNETVRYLEMIRGRDQFLSGLSQVFSMSQQG